MWEDHVFKKMHTWSTEKNLKKVRISVVSIHCKRAKFVVKVEHFQLSFTAFFPTKSAWNSVLFDAIAYLFAGARSIMVNGNHAVLLYISKSTFKSCSRILHQIRTQLLSEKKRNTPRIRCEKIVCLKIHTWSNRGKFQRNTFRWAVLCVSKSTLKHCSRIKRSESEDLDIDFHYKIPYELS